MKAKNMKSNCSVIVLLLINYTLFSQDFSLNETFKWNYNVNTDVEVVYNNYNCDTKIITFEGNTVEYELTINAKAKKQEELDILKNYIKNIDYSGSSSRLELHNRFFKKRNNINSKSEITLLNNDEITVYSFGFTAVLKIPATAYLNLQSKYSEIEIGNIHQLTINSHDDNIYGKNIDAESNLILNAKYSKIVFNETGSADVNVHDCALDFTKTRDLKIVSKYSEFDVVKSEAVSIESHDDKFNFNETENIGLNAKYTDFKSEVSGDVRLKLHDCNIKMAIAQNISIENSKYSDYIFENLQGVKITSSHDDNFSIRNLNTLENANTKYSDYKIGTLNKNFSIHYGHDDRVSIEEITPGFVNYYQNGKYGKIKINLNPKVDFIFNCSGKYLKIDSHVNGLKINSDKTQSSIRNVEGIKGVQRENMPVIKVEGHDMNLKLY